MAKIIPKKTLNAEAQEKALSEIQREDKKKVVQRVTIDLPQFVYDQVKAETEATGQTIKGFMLWLLREHFIKVEAEKRKQDE